MQDGKLIKVRLEERGDRIVLDPQVAPWNLRQEWLPPSAAQIKIFFKQSKKKPKKQSNKSTPKNFYIFVQGRIN